MRQLMTTAVVIAVLSIPFYAQQPTSASPSATTIIDGSQTPQLIPDLLAYRLYFLTVTSLPPAIGAAQLQSAGLQPSDVQAAVLAATTFRTAYDSLSNGYNQQVTAGANPDIIAFGTQRDTLVLNIQTALKNTLTSAGMTSLDAHIQSEKKRMKISGITTMPPM